jgi:GxxExxY protein
MDSHDELAGGLEEPGDDIDEVAAAVVEAAVEVHRVLGPGFFEGIYEQALVSELVRLRIPFSRQPAIGVNYKGRLVGDLRPDLLVGQRLVVELKTVEQLSPLHLAQALAYLKATHLRLALVINFNVRVLLRGVRRVIFTPNPPQKSSAQKEKTRAPADAKPQTFGER